MATFTSKTSLEKFAGPEYVTIGKIDSNYDKVDAALGTLWINDGATPSNSDLYHGRVVRELTSGKSWTAKDDGSGGFTLMPQSAVRQGVLPTGFGAMAGAIPGTVATQLLILPINNVVTIASGTATIVFPTPFPNGLLAVSVMNGDASPRPGDVVTISASSLGSVQVKCYASPGVLTSNGPFRITGVAVGW